jgi:peptidoglycan/LPS O-acetylase OafA/YrhL
LVSEPRLEEAVDRAWRWLAAVAGLSVAVLLWSWVSGTWDRLEDDGPVSALLDLGQATVMWVVVLALLALGKRFLSFETPFLRWANEGAYPIYLLHQSVIIVVAYLVLTAWEAPALAGFMVVATASLVVTVVTYELLVKPWSPTRFLFGMKPLPVRGANGGRARVAVGGARMPATDGSPRA